MKTSTPKYQNLNKIQFIIAQKLIKCVGVILIIRASLVAQQRGFCRFLYQVEEVPLYF